MATKKTTKKKVQYSVILQVLGRTYRAKGDTLEKAILALQTPPYVKGPSLMTVTKGKTERTKLLPANTTSRLFAPMGTLAKGIALKRTAELFNI